MEPSDIAVREADGVTVVTLEGEHDLGTASELESEINDGLDRQGAVVVDLGAASFVDSSILGTIVEGRRRAAERGAGFAVCLDGEGAPGVTRVLDVSGLRDALPVHPSCQEAIEQARGAEVTP